MANINGGTIQFGIKYAVDQSGLNELKKSLQQISALQVKEFAALDTTKTLEQSRKELSEIKKQASAVGEALNKSFNFKLNTYDLKEFNTQLKNQGYSIKDITTNWQKMGARGKAAIGNLAAELGTSNLRLKETNSLINSMATTLTNSIKWSISSSIVKGFTDQIGNAYNYIKNLDSSLNDIRIVTGQSAEQMDKFAVAANSAAQQLGASTLDYTKAALIYYQQGLSDADVKARTDITLKTANVTQQQADAVSEQLTAVWNGYKVSAQEAELYIDKMAAVAATTASNLQELSAGMQKVASAANIMGVDIDQLNAQLSTVVSVTRQAPEQVGTAFKTIYARMSTIASGGEDDDGATLTSYTKKMNEFGISVLDSTGSLRDMGEVIEEIGNKWTTLTREQQISLAQTAAGTRQYNNLLALFDNWDMYSKALETSANATGTLNEQNSIYLESLAAKEQQLQTATDDLLDSLFRSDNFKPMIDLMTSLVSSAADFVDGIGGAVPLFSQLGAILLSIQKNKVADAINSGVENFQRSLGNRQEIRGIAARGQMIQQEFSNVQGEEMDNFKSKLSNLGANAKLLSIEDINKSEEALRKYMKAFSDLENAKGTVEGIEKALQSLGIKGESAYETIKQILSGGPVENDTETLILAINEGFQKGSQEVQTFKENLDNLYNLRDNQENFNNSLKSMQDALASLQIPEEIKNKLINQLTEIGTESKRTGDKVRENLLKSLESSKTTPIDSNYFNKIFKHFGKKGFNQNTAIAAIKAQAEQYGKEYLNEISKILGESPNSKQVRQAIQRLFDINRENQKINKQITIFKDNLTTVFNQIATDETVAEGTANLANTLINELETGLDSVPENLKTEITAILQQVTEGTDTSTIQFNQLYEKIKALQAESKGAFSNLDSAIALLKKYSEEQGENLDDLIKKIEQLKTGSEEAKNELEEIDKATKLKSIITSVTSVVTAVTQAASAASSLINIWTQSDEDASIGEKMLQTAVALLPVLTQVSDILALFPAKNAAIGASGAAAGLQVSIAGHKAQLSWGWISVIASVAAIAVTAIASWVSSIETAEKKAERLNKAQNELVKSTQELENKYQNIKSSIQEIYDLKDSIDNMVVGTQEWTQAVEELNKKSNDLINTYKILQNPEYAEFDFETKTYKLTEEGIKKLEEQIQAEKRVNNLALNLNRAREQINTNTQAYLLANGGYEDFFGQHYAGYQKDLQDWIVNNFDSFKDILNNGLIDSKGGATQGGKAFTDYLTDIGYKGQTLDAFNQAILELKEISNDLNIDTKEKFKQYFMSNTQQSEDIREEENAFARLVAQYLPDTYTEGQYYEIGKYVKQTLQAQGQLNADYLSQDQLETFAKNNGYKYEKTEGTNYIFTSLADEKTQMTLSQEDAALSYYTQQILNNNKEVQDAAAEYDKIISDYQENTGLSKEDAEKYYKYTRDPSKGLDNLTIGAINKLVNEGYLGSEYAVDTKGLNLDSLKLSEYKQFDSPAFNIIKDQFTGSVPQYQGIIQLMNTLGKSSNNVIGDLKKGLTDLNIGWEQQEKLIPIITDYIVSGFGDASEKISHMTTSIASVEDIMSGKNINDTISKSDFETLSNFLDPALIDEYFQKLEDGSAVVKKDAAYGKSYTEIFLGNYNQDLKAYRETFERERKKLEGNKTKISDINLKLKGTGIAYDKGLTEVRDILSLDSQYQNRYAQVQDDEKAVLALWDEYYAGIENRINELSVVRKEALVAELKTSKDQISELKEMRESAAEDEKEIYDAQILSIGEEAGFGDSQKYEELLNENKILYNKLSKNSDDYSALVKENWEDISKSYGDNLNVQTAMREYNLAQDEQARQTAAKNLIKQWKAAYDGDESNYRIYLQTKWDDENLWSYYTEQTKNDENSPWSKLVNYWKDSYSIDLENCKTYAEAKAKILDSEALTEDALIRSGYLSGYLGDSAGRKIALDKARQDYLKDIGLEEGFKTLEDDFNSKTAGLRADYYAQGNTGDKDQGSKSIQRTDYDSEKADVFAVIDGQIKKTKLEIETLQNEIKQAEESGNWEQVHNLQLSLNEQLDTLTKFYQEKRELVKKDIEDNKKLIEELGGNKNIVNEDGTINDIIYKQIYDEKNKQIAAAAMAYDNAENQGASEEAIAAAKEAYEEAKDDLKEFGEAVKNYIQDTTETLPSITKEISDLAKAEKLGNVDTFAEVDYQLSRINKELSKLQKLQNGLSGTDLQRNLQEQINLLEKRNKLLTDKKVAKQAEINAKAFELEKSFGHAGFAINEDGTTTYRETLNSLVQTAEQLWQEYEVADEASKIAAKEQYDRAVEEINALIQKFSEYLALQRSLDEIEDQLEENIQKQIDAQIKAFDAKIKFQLDMDDLNRQWMEFIHKIQKIKWDIWGNDILDETKFNIEKLATLPKTITTSLSGLNRVTEAIRTMKSGKTDSIFGDAKQGLEQAISMSKEYRERAMKDIESMGELIEQIERAYLDMIDRASETLSDHIKQFELINDIFEHNKKLTTMLTGENYAALDKYYKLQEKNNNAQIATLKQQTEMWKSRMNAAEFGSEEWVKLRNEYEQSLGSLNSAVENAAQNIIDEYTNVINLVFEEFEQKLTNGSSLKDMGDEWERINTQAEMYYDNINGAYEIEKLRNKYIQSIDNTKDIIAQERLTKLMNQQVQALKEKENLSKYDVDRANLLYDIELKKMALEDAKANKSKMRLRRDAQGNYSYQYVADTEEISNAQQAVNDLQNQLYNLDKEAYKQNLDQIYKYNQELNEKLKEIAADNTLNEEEKLQKMEDLNRYYTDIINKIADDNIDIRKNLNQSAFDEMINLGIKTQEEIDGMTREQMNKLMSEVVPQWNQGIQMMIDKIAADGGFGPIVQDIINTIMEKHIQYQNSLREMATAAGIDLDNITNGYDNLYLSIEEIINQSGDMVAAMDEQMTAAQNLTAQVQALKEEYLALVDAMKAAMEANLSAQNMSMDQSPSTEKSGINDISNFINAAVGATEDFAETMKSSSDVANAAKKPQKKYLIETALQNGGTGSMAAGQMSLWKQYYGTDISKIKISRTELGKQNGLQSGEKIDIDKLIEYLSKSWLRIKESPEAYDTGGYTGKWGPEGKLAVLHQKELILNAKDTENMLNIINQVREITAKMGNLNIKSSYGISDLNSNNTLDQNVHIEATFPNATNSNEIQSALENLVNTASQYAFRNRR